MRRLALTFFVLLSVFAASAQSLLDTIEQSLATLGAYKVEFTVNLDNSYTFTGRYIVEGANFYVGVKDTELYELMTTKPGEGVFGQAKNKNVC